MMFVVMKIQDFDFEPKQLFGIEAKFDMGKMIGFLPVYEKREDAEQDFPKTPILEAKEVAK